MGAILYALPAGPGGILTQVILLLSLAVYSSYGGGCTFPPGWTGSWFQSGTPGLIAINSTHIHSKGECSETDSYDKFLLYDRSEDCFRCMVIHEKHKYVLQYKETYCSSKDSLASICEMISGDAALYSMFRKEPRPIPEQCPFHPPPFTFTYNRGSGDCTNPPSRAESCTDDSRLLLRYMACPDVPGTESNVEELVCLATWKEGSTRYLVGQISQVNRRNSIASDEDTYRCFIYKGQHNDKTMTYNIAQSGDATCNGLSSPTDGSRTMKLTNSDDEHNRCHFPSWIVDHHKWFSLDHSHQYHFTKKNATLKIMNSDGSFEEMRLVCHSILEQKDKKHIKLIAHVTSGCESGHVCLKLWRRAGGVLELQQSAARWELAAGACADRDLPHVTLVTTSLMPMRCPIIGRYSVINSLPDKRRRRQQTTIGDTEIQDVSQAECSPEFSSVFFGCGAQQDTIEFKAGCSDTVYSCYGGWAERGAGFVIAASRARASAAPRALCLRYLRRDYNDTRVGVEQLSVSIVSRSCDRSVVPGIGGDNAYNLTKNGTCEQSSMYNSSSVRLLPHSLAIVFAIMFANMLAWR
ncbi:uncharacterized protein LOC128681695 [Plodia interpunctella]|uniref:uncharacterized protein LOC128681695 n=1 Tax=Plodia interpunctella TaxID=58824 RepID=UPI002368AB45|nr:uncharacterized protein LOC128681695 [Plodia interpunctella]